MYPSRFRAALSGGEQQKNTEADERTSIDAAVAIQLFLQEDGRANLLRSTEQPSESLGINLSSGVQLPS